MDELGEFHQAFFQCVKTGCLAKIDDRYAYGDLYRFSDGYVLKAVQWTFVQKPFAGCKVHAQFTTWECWWEPEMAGGRYDIIFLRPPEWFDYIGRDIDTC